MTLVYEYLSQYKSAIFLPLFFVLILASCKSDDCDRYDCSGVGTCINGACMCDEGFTGDNCQTEMCSQLDCGEFGTCVTGTCNCENGYMGELCNELVVDLFVDSNGSNWQCTESCSPDDVSYASSMFSSTNQADEMIINNFANLSGNLVVNIYNRGFKQESEVNFGLFNLKNVVGELSEDGTTVMVSYERKAFNTDWISCMGTWQKQ